MAPLPCAGAGFNSWESLSRHHSRDLTRMCLSWGAAVEDWDAQSILPSWLRHGAPIGIPEEVETAGAFPPCHGEEPRRNPASLCTCLAGWSNHTRTSFQSLSNFYRPKKQGATAGSSIPWTNSIATGVEAMLCCPSSVSSPNSNRIAVRSTGLSGIFFGRTSIPPCPSPSGSCCHGWKDAVADSRHLFSVHLDMARRHTDPTIRAAVHVWNGRRTIHCLRGPRHGRKVLTRNLGSVRSCHWSRGVVSLQRRRVELRDPRGRPAPGRPGERSRIFTFALLAIAVLGFSPSWDKACLGDRVVWVGANS